MATQTDITAQSSEQKGWGATIKKFALASGSVLAAAASLMSTYLLSPLGSRRLVAHQLLSDGEFAASFRNGAFKHLHDTHADEYKTAWKHLSDLAEEAKAESLQSKAAKELQKGGVTWKECFKALTHLQKGLLFSGMIGGGAISVIALKKGFFNNSQQSEPHLFSSKTVSLPSVENEKPDNFHIERMQQATDVSQGLHR